MAVTRNLWTAPLYYFDNVLYNSHRSFQVLKLCQYICVYIWEQIFCLPNMTYVQILVIAAFDTHTLFRQGFCSLAFELGTDLSVQKHTDKQTAMTKSTQKYTLRWKDRIFPGPTGVRKLKPICQGCSAEFWELPTWGPFYQHGLTLIPAWISDHMHSKLWGEITYSFPNFNGAIVEVWE